MALPADKPYEQINFSELFTPAAGLLKQLT